MGNLHVVALVGALVAVAAAPAGAEESLLERNYRLLREMVPEGSMVEVTIMGLGPGPVTEQWSAERFAAFRAERAAMMGIDYAAGAGGGSRADSHAPVPVPSCRPVPLGSHPGPHPCEQLYLVDIWADLWGDTPVGTCAGRGLPGTIPVDDKLWLYGGGDAKLVCLYEHADRHNGCILLWGWVLICSSTYGWFYPQAGDVHCYSWHAGTGLFYLFPEPWGALFYYNGVALAEDLGSVGGPFGCLYR